MDPILEILFDEETPKDTKEIYKDNSVWIKDGKDYRGSNNVKLVNKIEPGSYVANMSREVGLFCSKIESQTDKLFIFKDNVINGMVDEIQAFWDKSDEYAKEELMHKRGILMYGEPGTGKTSTIELLSDDLIKRGGVVFKVQSPNDLQVHINFLQFCLRLIEPDTPVITILEDIDKYSNFEMELLDFLDGKSQINHHVVIMTTNDTSELPDNLLRPSRVDLKVYVPTPSESVRREFLEFKKVPEEDVDELVELTKDFSIADLKEVFICKYLLNYSTEDAVDKINDTDFSKENFMNGSSGGKKLAI